MGNSFKEALWKQFGASIDMLDNAIAMCPDGLWDTEEKFWYSSYHCLFWLDYYLTPEPSTFTPTPPYTLSEFNPTGEMPERTYSKDELLNYLKSNREKLRKLLSTLTDEEIVNRRWVNDYKNFSLLEILLYNMRHVQHHAAQLNKFLRKNLNNAPAWISQSKQNLD
jgi:hypothetical protein